MLSQESQSSQVKSAEPSAALDPQRKAQYTDANVAVRQSGTSSELVTLFRLASMGMPSSVQAGAPNLGIDDDENLPLDHEKRKISKSLLRVLLAALRSYDPYIHTHSQRVALIATGIGGKLGWSEDQLRELEVAALLHDFGKISVPQHILNKPGKLNSIEREIMSRNLFNASCLLHACQVPQSIITMIIDAERAQIMKNRLQNVTQYGTSIGARILAVADAYDSLRCKQVYRSGKSHDDVMQILNEQSPSRFDTSVVSALQHWIDQDASPRMMYEGDVNQSVEAEPSHDRLETVLVERNIHQVMHYLVSLDEHYSGFYLVDHKLDILMWSQGMQQITGMAANELIHTDWKPELLQYFNEKRKLVDLENQALLLAHSSKKSVLSTSYRMNEDGQLDEYEVQSIPILNDKQQLLGVLEILFSQEKVLTGVGDEMQQLKLAASRDALTKIPNRGELERLLQQMFEQFERKGTKETFSAIFFDVDYFKSINDSHGHAVGDRVLIDLARLLEAETYSGEIVGRYGGEEFVVLCPKTDIDMAVQKANRFRLAIENASVGGLPHASVTSSFGVAQTEPGDVVSDVVRRADKALYHAKETGRNKVCSLTRQELELEQTQPGSEKAVSSNEFEFQQMLTACTSSDMIVYKLKAFVEANHAVLKEVDPAHVVMNVGRPGLLTNWGKTFDRQPVKVVLEIERNQRKQGGQAIAEILATVTPSVKPREAASFQRRAAQVIRSLKEYLASS